MGVLSGSSCWKSFSRSWLGLVVLMNYWYSVSVQMDHLNLSMDERLMFSLSFRPELFNGILLGARGGVGVNLGE